ncbi:MAG: type II secretion system protein M [Proteobacteria bacterium]|nr:type II secretion system protein M [Pseudomonadota bacterium]MBU1686375.1 type II secretion system protein M [Pseudomonadota bacterium]
MKISWNDLNQREKYTLGLGLTALAIVLGYFLLIDPFLTEYSRLRQRVPGRTAELAWMRGAALEVAHLRGAGPKGATTDSPLKIIDRAARRFRVSSALKRVEPAEDGQVKIWMEQVVFIDLMRWLRSMSGEYGLNVFEISVDRQEAAGIVNARLTMKTSQ